jgi:hypothetical protein
MEIYDNYNINNNHYHLNNNYDKSIKKNDNELKWKSERDQKFMYVQILYIFILLIILYLIWKVSQIISYDKLLIYVGILCMICFIFKKWLGIGLLLAVIYPAAIIDDVPLGCFKVSQDKYYCI